VDNTEPRRCRVLVKIVFLGRFPLPTLGISVSHLRSSADHNVDMASPTATSTLGGASTRGGMSSCANQQRRRTGAVLGLRNSGGTPRAPSLLGRRRRGRGDAFRCSAALPELLGAAVIVKYAAAGAVGSVVSHCGAVPLDVIKTRVQIDPEKFAGQGWLQNGQTLVAEEGAGVLLGGLGSTTLGYSVHGGIKYGGFEALKYALVHHGGGVAAGSPIAAFVVGRGRSLVLPLTCRM